MYAGQHHLGVSGLGQARSFLRDFLHRAGADAPAHIRDDAVGAVAVAALLYLHHRAGMPLRPGNIEQLKGHTQHAVHRGDAGILRHGFLQQLHHLAPALVADDQPQPHGQQGFGLLLRQTAGQHHLRGRVLLDGAAHGLQALLFTGAGHHAAVDHIDIRLLVKIAALIACGQKLLQHGLAVVLVDLAPQCIKRDCRHMLLFHIARKGQ